MTLISKEKIAELHKVNQENCVSIFIPTHRAGKKVLQREDTLYLKNQLKDVKTKLSKKGLDNRQISNFVRPVEELIEDVSFWRNLSDGLAIFLANGVFEKFVLPVHFKEFNYVSTEFYLKPLMPMFVGDGEFYLMSLALSDVKLYKCSKHSYAEIIIDDLIPASKQDRVGYEFEQKNLQFRTQQASGDQVMYHGHEPATAKRKNEIKKYFRAINDGIIPVLKDRSIPFFIASQDYLFDIYKTVNTYPNLHERAIKVNLNATDASELHELAWELIEPIFDQERKDKIALFRKEEGTGKTAIGIGKVLPAAIDGKIDALFCENKADIFGSYKKENNTIVVSESEDDHGVSLMNLAAVEALIKGGKVYLLDKEDMPNPNAKLNALYRF